jgi:DNA-binding winged helix-turn-helix (wHTH) protein
MNLETRQKPPEDGAWMLGYLALELNEGEQRVRRQGHTVDLSHSPLQWSILKALVDAQGIPLSEDQLRRVWDRYGVARKPTSGTITDAISEVRRAIEPLGVSIKSLRKLGRKLVPVSPSKASQE